MKQLLLSAAALVGLAASAAAADLPPRLPHAYPPAPVIVAPAFTWTGFYGGANVGYAFRGGDDSGRPGVLRTPNPPGPGFTVTPRDGVGTFLRRGADDGGILGGGQVGYNMQSGMFVGGIEADLQGIALGNDDGLPRGQRVADIRAGADPFFGIVFPNAAGGNVFFRDDNGRDDMDFFGTVRGRVGAAFDRTMIYATGGLAWRGGGDNTRAGTLPASFWSVFSPGSAARGTRLLARLNNEDDGEDIGWTLGGGFEYAFTNMISAKIEGLYVDIGDDRRGRRIVGVTNTGQPITLNRRTDHNEFGLVRAGVNVRFGGL